MLGIIILLVLAIFLSAFFSGAEVAIVSISKVKARHLVDQKVKHAKTLLTLKEHPRSTLITILIGNNLVNIGGSALATKLAIDLFDSAGVGIATGVMTFLILTFGEIAPKTFATRNAKKVALTIAPIVRAQWKILYPFVWLFLRITDLFGKPKGKEEPLVTEQEVRHLIRLGEEEGQIKHDEKEMIHRIFRFDDIEVQAVMTPRTDIFALDYNMNIADALPLIVEHEYSRVPVYTRSVDRIKGIIFLRDILQTISAHKTAHKLKDIMQPALFVPEHKKIDKLLKELQEKKTHMAIVVNEHGGLEGLITIEDILEEIVGEIFDESDEVEHLIKQKGDDRWLILGKTTLETIKEELGIALPQSDDYNTIAGLLHHQLGRIPLSGERCALKQAGVELFIRRTEGPIIVDVLLRKK